MKQDSKITDMKLTGKGFKKIDKNRQKGFMAWQ